MTFSQIIWGDKSTKNGIVDTLAASWPLTLKKLYYELRHKQGISVTYQAVHKALHELVDSRIVLKEEKGYSLNKEWISALKDFSARLNLSYHVASSTPAVDFTSCQLEFDTMWDMYVMMLDAIESGVLDPTKKRLGACIFHHFYMWCPLLFSKREYDQIKNIAKQNKCYMAGTCETAMDNFVANFYTELGWKIKDGIPFANPLYDTVVHGDTVMQVYFDPQIKEIMGKVFAKLEDFSNASLHPLFMDIFHQKTKIIIMINKNEKIAEQIHQHVHSFFTPEERYPEHR